MQTNVTQQAATLITPATFTALTAAEIVVVNGAGGADVTWLQETSGTNKP